MSEIKNIVEASNDVVSPTTQVSDDVLAKITENRRKAQERRTIFLKNQASSSSYPPTVPIPTPTTSSSSSSSSPIQSSLSPPIRNIDTSQIPDALLSKRSYHDNELICQYISSDDIDTKICGSIEIDNVMLESFDERICKRCRLKSTEWEYVNKATLMSEYLIPDGHTQAMKYITKVNPHNSAWQPMRLYLKKHAEEVSLHRWGSYTAIEKERARRKAEKYERQKIKESSSSSMQFKSLKELQNNNNTSSITINDNDNDNDNNDNNNDDKMIDLSNPYEAGDQRALLFNNKSNKRKAAVIASITGKTIAGTGSSNKSAKRKKKIAGLVNAVTG